MDAFLSFTVVGLVIGCIYALTASGLVVTYTTSGVFNFAHGAIGMVAAYMYWQLSVAWHWPQLLAMLMVLLVIAPIFGAVVERVLIRPLYGAPVDITVVVTLGLMLTLFGVAYWFWNPSTIRRLPRFFPENSVRIFGFNVLYHQIIVMIVAVAVAIALRYFFARTRTGIAMRGVVDNPDLVAMAGGRPERIQQLSWALGASLAALAGMLLAPLVQLDILTLTLLVVNGYVAAMVGRLKSLPLTIVGALGLGLGITYSVGYLDISFLSQIQLVLPMVLLFIVLIVMRQGRLRVGTVAGHGIPQPATLTSSIVWGAVLVVAVFLVGPHLADIDSVRLSQGLALALLLLSLVLLTGYGGLTSLCHMTFAGVGAFAMGHLGRGGSLLGLLAAVGMAAGFGLVLGLPTLRLRGLYLALATLAFASAMDGAFFTNAHVFGTGGSIEVARPDFFGLPRSDRAYMVELAAIFALAGIALLAVRRGRIGRRLAAIDDSPAACATLGVNINWTRIAVFTISAGLAGLAGALYAAAPGRVTNNDFFYLLSLIVLLQLRVGGVNTVTGALFGALFFAMFKLFTDHGTTVTLAGSHLDMATLQFLLTGIAAIVVSRDPNGLGGHISEAAEKLRQVWTRRGSPGTPLSSAAVEQPEPAHV
jgi:branched-chain amino acid transport system permease protein